MDTIYEIKNATTLLVTKPAETPVAETKEYTLDFLEQQELSILKQKNDYVEARDKELAEVRELISQAKLIGIKSEIELEVARDAILVK